jgi:hypothetical protein
VTKFHSQNSRALSFLHVIDIIYISVKLWGALVADVCMSRL